MRGLRGWVLAFVLAVLIGGLAYVAQPRQDSPEHSSNSDAGNGTSAARLFAQALGHPTNTIEGNFSPPDQNGLMFVFTPTSPYTADHANQTAEWVRLGGVLVYADERGDPELDRALSVTRLNGFVPSQKQLANPVLEGVTVVSGGENLMALPSRLVSVWMIRSLSPQSAPAAGAKTRRTPA